MDFRRVAGQMAAALSLFALSAAALAQAYPSKPLRMVVPFAAGGPADSLARLLADKLRDAVGQPVVAENRPGAGTLVGAEVVAKSAADGHTLLLGSSSMLILPLLGPSPIEPLKDLAPVSRIALVPLVIGAHVGTPYRTLGELIAYAKANPEKVTFGVASYAGTDHLGFELLNLMAGTKMRAIVYKGAAAQIPDLIAGRVDLQMTTPSFLKAHVDSGKVKLLAATTEKRLPAIANVPTVAESGYPGYEAIAFYAMYAPAGTPRDIVARLDREFRQITQAADSAEKISALSFIVDYAGPEALAANGQRQVETLRDVIKRAGIKMP